MKKFIAIALGIILAIFLYEYDRQIFRDFSCEYDGVLWKQNEEIIENVTIEFLGKKNKKGEFEGDIILVVNDSVFQSWENCKVVNDNGAEFFICPVDRLTQIGKEQPLGAIAYADCAYAIMVAQDNWSTLSMLLATDGEERTLSSRSYLITAPADTLEEAYNISSQYLDTDFFGFLIHNLYED